MEFITSFFNQYHTQIIATIITLVVIFLIKFIINRIIKKYSAHANIKEIRIKIIIKYFNVLINIIGFVLLITIWGVTPQWLFASFASFFAIVGVAFFAQWSILSNVTAGFIIYFASPFKIGDTIKILDKDMGIEAKVEDIKAFYVILLSKEGLPIMIPNNLILQKAIYTISREE
ncbi:mechanosensitive ion channel family protein [Apibacter muscae]|uniref:mechanosensitive ion channel family protein n=1 Tax=Apibacter muscae TaxID=2509004 RepID=UPI0011AD3EB9|nr:mechanosensitive ion channel family protein [Apibacter muscae]TWP24899.1 mechanosensitive ion channel family protein [Apibacter muscae]